MGEVSEVGQLKFTHHPWISGGSKEEGIEHWFLADLEHNLIRDVKYVFLYGKKPNKIVWYLSMLLLFSRSVLSNFLQPHGLQQTRLPRPSPTPGACSNSCPLSQWCHPITLVLCCPLLPSVFPSIKVFSKELALYISWPKYCSFSFSISCFNEYSGLVSFRVDWFDLAVQGTQESSPTPQF